MRQSATMNPKRSPIATGLRAPIVRVLSVRLLLAYRVSAPHLLVRDLAEERRTSSAFFTAHSAVDTYTSNAFRAVSPLIARGLSVMTPALRATPMSTPVMTTWEAI